MNFWSRIKNAFSKDGRKQSKDSGGVQNSDKEWKVEKKPREYEQVDLPDDKDEGGDQNNDKKWEVVKQPRSYEEVTIGDGPDEKPRLSSKSSGGQLNYIDVEFTKDKKTNSKKKEKDKSDENSTLKPTVEYTEVTIQDSHINVHD